MSDLDDERGGDDPGEEGGDMGRGDPDWGDREPTWAEIRDARSEDDLNND